jgi:hypothetical protein
MAIERGLGNRHFDGRQPDLQRNLPSDAFHQSSELSLTNKGFAIRLGPMKSETEGELPLPGDRSQKGNGAG